MAERESVETGHCSEAEGSNLSEPLPLSSWALQWMTIVRMEDTSQKCIKRHRASG